MATRIVREPILKAELAAIAKEQFGDLVKAVVDVGRGIMAVGGELHADEELWGVNLYPAKAESEWIEFDSMINVRPSQGNPSRNLEDAATRERIRGIVARLVH